MRAAQALSRPRQSDNPKGMATKAEQHRAATERSGPKKPKQSKHPRRSPPADTSLPGVGADARRGGAGSTAAQRKSNRARGKAAFALEDSATTPSRKSTRRSANHQKHASNLTRRETRSSHSPEFVAAASVARSTKVRGGGKKSTKKTVAPKTAKKSRR